MELIKHRGPDASGWHIRDNVGLGHKRLAIFDLSDAAKQPLLIEDHGIVFNGAIYNYRELRQELEKKGYSFFSRSDTEVILQAYRHWGPACVHRFNGQWAFAVYDPLRKKIFCSRDRFGIKPFYYVQFGQKFCFASEIKAFRAFGEWQPELNRPRAYEFLAYGYHDHTEETLFAGVRQLGKGKNLWLDLNTGRLQVESYYDLRKQIQLNPDKPEVAKEKFLDCFKTAIDLRLRADVAVGANLSGGIDSSSIVGLASQKQPDLSTFSVCFKEKSINEELYVDAVLQQHPLVAHKIRPGLEELQASIRNVTWYNDEPIASLSVVAQHLLFQKVWEEGIKSTLGGQGADEILAGYEKFYLPLLKQAIRRKIGDFFTLLYQIQKLHHIKLSDALNRYFLYAGKNKSRANTSYWNPDFVPAKGQLFQRRPDRTVSDTSLNLLYEVGLATLLHYEDRNAMAFGVESRLPFLDHHLVEYALSLPDHLKIHQGIRKYILREAMRSYLPEKIYHRYDKIGFAAPDDRLTPHLLPQVEDFVNRQTSIFHPHFELKTASADLIRRIYFFKVWMELFL